MSQAVSARVLRQDVLSLTIIAEPLFNDIGDKLKVEVMENRKNIFKQVKGYINSELNPSKTNLYYTARDDFEEVSSIEDIFILLQVSISEYKEALSLSDVNGFQVHLKRALNSCFANLDIQLVFNKYKVVVYISAYLSKSEEKFR